MNAQLETSTTSSPNSRERPRGLKAALVAAGALAGLALSGPAHASGMTGYGYIADYLVTSNGGFLFYVAGPRSTPPACSGPGLDQRWAVNASTPAGQAEMSALLTAMAAHKRVSVQGIHSCDIQGDTETVWFFEVENP